MSEQNLEAVSARPLSRMIGRDPQAEHRVSTPLELLFDLSVVAAIGVAANQFAQLVAANQVGFGLMGFVFAMFTICGAWINFSWFASAFDTDDFFYRIATLVQMIGVIILALGLPTLFHSIAGGVHVDYKVAVSGYVVMRVALVAQWCRVAIQDSERRPTALTYVRWVTCAQVGWVALAAFDLNLAITVVIAAILSTIEFYGPITAERRISGTPWHPHHLAERYGLLAIIALGEGIFGTVTAVSAILDRQGWDLETIAVVISGTGIIFGMWWTYFILPSGTLLVRHRNKLFGWGYGHIIVYISIAAVGSGLHVSALVVEGVASLSTFGAVVAVSAPVEIFLLAHFALYRYLLEDWDQLQGVLMFGTSAILVVAAGLAAAGASLGVCLSVVTLSPVTMVIGFETAGKQRLLAALNRLALADSRA